MFQKAIKEESKLRLAICGPPGSGKTYSALAIAREFGRVAVLDTENKSSQKYADEFDFEVASLGQSAEKMYTPDNYIELIKGAEQARYDILIIDSFSHAWAGDGGVLDMAGGNFGNWKVATPAHNRLVKAVLFANLHIIATMRSKVEYVVETNERGKSVPRKVGLAPVQKADTEYEFDIYGEIDHQHDLVITKSRAQALQDVRFHKPGSELAGLIKTWLAGVIGPTRFAQLAKEAVENQDAPRIRELIKSLRSGNLDSRPINVPADQIDTFVARLEERLAGLATK